MKKFILAGFAMLIFLAGFGQSSDEKNAQKRNVAGFHGVEISNGIDLYLTSGPESVSVYASSNMVWDQIKTEVVGGILKIYIDREDKQGISKTTHMSAYVSFTGLDRLSASGGSDVFVKNQMDCDRLDINLSGGSDLKGKLNANSLVLKQSGGSDVDISGIVKNLDVSASGGSDLGGYDLVSEYANLSASGGSDCRLTVNKELKVVASGGSDVHYHGTATVSKVVISGSSSVNGKQ